MSRIISVFLIIFIVLASSGCMEHRIKRNKHKCKKYGFEPGTDAFANCVQHGVMADERRMDRAFEDEY